MLVLSRNEVCAWRPRVVQTGKSHAPSVEVVGIERPLPWRRLGGVELY